MQSFLSYCTGQTICFSANIIIKITVKSPQYHTNIFNKCTNATGHLQLLSLVHQSQSLYSPYSTVLLNFLQIKFSTQMWISYPKQREPNKHLVICLICLSFYEYGATCEGSCWPGIQGQTGIHCGLLSAPQTRLGDTRASGGQHLGP